MDSVKDMLKDLVLEDGVIDMIFGYKQEMEDYDKRLKYVINELKFECIWKLKLNHNSLNEKYMNEMFGMYIYNMYQFYEKVIIKYINKNIIDVYKILNFDIDSSIHNTIIYHNRDSPVFVIYGNGNEILRMNEYMSFFDFEKKFGF